MNSSISISGSHRCSSIVKARSGSMIFEGSYRELLEIFQLAAGDDTGGGFDKGTKQTDDMYYDLAGVGCSVNGFAQVEYSTACTPNGKPVSRHFEQGETFPFVQMRHEEGDISALPRVVYLCPSVASRGMA